MEYTWSSCCKIVYEDKKLRRPLNEAFIQCSNQPTEKCSKIPYKRFYCGLNLYPITCILITDVLPEGDGASLDGATRWNMAAAFCMHVHVRHALQPSLDLWSLSGTYMDKERRCFAYLMDCGHKIHFLLPVCFEPLCFTPPSGKVSRFCCSEGNFCKLVSCFCRWHLVNTTY
jgi:hypothetical protein